MSAENNGGRTGYYDLPLPDKDKLTDLLNWYKKTDLVDTSTVVTEILKLCPQTLNDLIEAKNMQPWQHEVFKATYALEARTKKNGGSRLREINKILYYAGRGKSLAEKSGVTISLGDIIAASTVTANIISKS